MPILDGWVDPDALLRRILGYALAFGLGLIAGGVILRVFTDCYRVEEGVVNLSAMFKEADARRKADAERFTALDMDQCQLCLSSGPDKRSLWLECFYAIHEVVPEAIELSDVEAVPEERRRSYYLRICKNCRGELLAMLAQWREDAIARRVVEKDDDGHPETHSPERNIPVRQNGRIVWYTAAEFETQNAP